MRSYRPVMTVQLLAAEPTPNRSHRPPTAAQSVWETIKLGLLALMIYAILVLVMA